MNEITNHVVKVITDTDAKTYIFIINTEGDQDFWWWQVDFSDVAKYFKESGYNPLYLYSLYSTGGLTQTMAEMFCNDIDNTLYGVSCSSYKAIDEILKEFEIIK